MELGRARISQFQVRLDPCLRKRLDTICLSLSALLAFHLKAGCPHVVVKMASCNPVIISYLLIPVERICLLKALA